ncbi:hypothetical protein GDO86_010718 [Hymenochirus boettgeri]|nr:hypothetical protein GDO86_010718 [Hymenochirus boettgeri]
MDIATSVALDLLETGCESTDVNAMETVMLEYASMERDLNQYIHAVEKIVKKLKHEQAEHVPDLLGLVKEKYDALQRKNVEDDLKRSERFVKFKEQVRDMRQQIQQNQEGDEGYVNVDEDIAVTQSQLNFTCPITQLEMKNPVKNKVCGHTYDKDAIENMILARHQKKKKATCPKVGCGHTNMQISDLVPDITLKRAIEIHKQKSQR